MITAYQTQPSHCVGHLRWKHRYKTLITSLHNCNVRNWSLMLLSYTEMWIQLSALYSCNASSKYQASYTQLTIYVNDLFFNKAMQWPRPFSKCNQMKVATSGLHRPVVLYTVSTLWWCSSANPDVSTVEETKALFCINVLLELIYSSPTHLTEEH